MLVIVGSLRNWNNLISRWLNLYKWLKQGYNRSKIRYKRLRNKRLHLEELRIKTQTQLLSVSFSKMYDLELNQKINEEMIRSVSLKGLINNLRSRYEELIRS